MNRTNKWFRISPLIFGTTVLIIIRLISDVPLESKFWERPLSQNLIEFVSVIIISFAIEYSLHAFVKKHRKKTGKLSVQQLIKEYIIILLSGIVITVPCIYVIHFFTNDPVGIDDLVIAEIVTSLLLVIYYSIFRGGDILEAYIHQKTLTQQIEKTQMETELKFLKAQFHPHFLFNALNAIYFQIDESNQAPRKAIEQLSELLRYQLYDINQTVKIRQELNFIRHYTEFMKVRMKPSFHLTIHVDPQLNGQPIHPLLLFPLVENAYKYIGGEYWITIDAQLKNGALSFHIENAIPAIAHTGNRKSGGIGLLNLQRRLNLLYPGKHSFSTFKKTNSFTANLSIEW
ncbi:sensor histidine kinase [Thermophagus sp. OGC60D27]|uniref:sensor histidine kinase n=1 Tax=Thermophagus sp. OGC60D27 TaxID=3458415 RepID=UPI0040381FC3